MLPCVCSVIDNRRRWNVVRKSETHSAIALCATFLFLPHFDVICDLLLNRRTATWNLFVTVMASLQPRRLPPWCGGSAWALQWARELCWLDLSRTPMPGRSKVRGQTKSNLLALQVWGFCIGLTTLSCKKLLLRKQQRVTYKNHLCRTSLRNPCHGQQWMPRVKTPETLQVIGFEWLTVAKAERKPLSWQWEPSAQKPPHWLAFGMCEQCMSKVGWRKSLMKWRVTNLIS